MLTREKLDLLQGRYTLAQLAQEAEREIGQRKKVYGRLVERQQMTPRAAEEKTDMMRCIAAILSAMADEDPKAAGRLL